jgi:hypothetical protein
VIYGQRRLGKTSVFVQLERRLNALLGEDGYVTVLLDLQAFTLRGSDYFWQEMAQFIQLRLKRRYPVPEPDLTLFETEAYLAFRQDFLPTVQSAIGERRLILMFDECMRLEDVIAQERLPTSIFDQFRSLMEQERHISVIYCLATVVSNLRPEFQEMLLNALSLHVTFLNEKAARALVTEPVTEFYEFDEEAINYLLDYTHRHPYFTQAFCRRVFFNWQDSQLTRATRADVLAALGKTTNSTMNNLGYLWIEATVAEKFVLAAIAEMEPEQANVRSLDRHLRQASIYLGRSQIKRALKGLHQREVIDSLTHPRINLGILRYWLRGAKGLWLVSRKFREYLPPMPKGQTEPRLSPTLTVALTKPWVREPRKYHIGLLVNR